MKKFISALFLLIFSLAIAESFDFTKVNIDSLNSIAHQAYQQENYQKAAEYYLQYMQYDVKNGSVCYNLACCYGLLGNEELAVKYLEHAYENGFTNLEHIQNDPDFDKVRNGKEFAALIKQLNRKNKAP